MFTIIIIIIINAMPPCSFGTALSARTVAAQSVSETVHVTVVVGMSIMLQYSVNVIDTHCPRRSALECLAHLPLSA